MIYKVSKYGSMLLLLVLLAVLPHSVVYAGGGCGDVYVEHVGPHSIELGWNLGQQDFQFSRVCYKEKWTLFPLHEECNQLGHPSGWSSDQVDGYVEVEDTSAQFEEVTLKGLRICTHYKITGYGFESANSAPTYFGDTEVRTSGTWWQCFISIPVVHTAIDIFGGGKEGRGPFTSWVGDVEDKLGARKLNAMIQKAYAEAATKEYGRERMLPWEKVVKVMREEEGIDLRKNNAEAIESLVTYLPPAYAALNRTMPKKLRFEVWLKVYHPKKLKTIRKIIEKRKAAG